MWVKTNSILHFNDDLDQQGNVNYGGTCNTMDVCTKSTHQANM